METTKKKPAPKAKTEPTPPPVKAEEPPGRPRQKPRNDRPGDPVLRFTPDAWAKLLYFRDRGQCEVGGFGLCAACGQSDLLLVTDFITVRQDVSVASVEFDDEAVADYFDDQIDNGLRPEQFARIWAHTHPGDSPVPSVTDEECFARVFGQCDWAVMFVLARGGKTYARLRFNTGPGGQIAIPVEVDYSAEFPGSDHSAWEAEYQRNINTRTGLAQWGRDAFAGDVGDICLADEWLDELEEMDPIDRQAVLCELNVRPDLWPEGGYAYA